MLPDQSTRIAGRAAQTNPANRFEAVHVEADFEHAEPGSADGAARRVVPTEFLADASRSIISENDSPDVGFRYSANAYRGCEHGCAYCYARPTHELLGLSAGLDFETKILVKHDAPRLLRAELAKPSWRGELIAMSGVTDCYQPAERRWQLTRQMLQVCSEARQCVAIITKNALVLRDLDVLAPLAAANLVQVNMSVTTLDAELARALEPRTSPPAARLEAIRQLAAAGIPVRALIAPVVPGLTDHELPAILAAAAAAGAGAASYILLRLPLAVRPLFLDWLRRNRPQLLDRVQSRIRSTRGGQLNDPRFGKRMRGTGRYAEQIAQTFRVFAGKHGLDQRLPPLDTAQFRPPRDAGGQLSMF